MNLRRDVFQAIADPTRRAILLFWVTTIFLAVGMTAGGVQQTFQIGGYNAIVTGLGYPLYILTILGIWKILGVVTILAPRLPLLKE